MFHLSDFVDYCNVYYNIKFYSQRWSLCTKALQFPLNKKIEIFKYAIDKIALYSSDDTLKNISIKKSNSLVPMIARFRPYYKVKRFIINI